MGLLKKLTQKYLSENLHRKIWILENKFLRGGYFGLNGLDRKLAEYLNYDNGFYVELGANDGVTQCNSLHFEIMKNWRGILIEPDPHNFHKCKSARSQSNAVFCAACVPFDFPDKFVEIKYNNLCSVAIGLDLDNPNVGNIENDISFGAKAVPLNTILNTANAPKRIDLLSLDVEGAELYVLKGLDFTAYRFSYMLIECRDIERMENYLSTKGYSQIAKLSYHDYLFKDDSI
nr:FkbM family methyltransferase [uncultured Cohaesibacter sp.]